MSLESFLTQSFVGHVPGDMCSQLVEFGGHRNLTDIFKIFKYT